MYSELISVPSSNLTVALFSLVLIELTLELTLISTPA
ncbi:unannotated protein [freshwater metagenome]|uniref:Unannotated protein n=1 Tax=freshwater metagenome TaxID=449393 RepID=A0A6J7TK62_9ZZZZ